MRNDIIKRFYYIVFKLILYGALAACGDGSDRPGDLAAATQGATRLAVLLGAGDAGYPKATEPRRFDFPADHGPHPEYRNEWWYLTGNLVDDRGRRFGFELTIFRFALAPGIPESASAWRTRQVYIGHFAITDPAGDRFRVAERYARGAAGLAGARGQPFRVWLEDWSIVSTSTPGQWRLQASAGSMSLDLELAPLKPPVLNGDAGLSRKSADPGNASYYYSLTRIRADGTLGLDDVHYRVSGLAWLDREWGSSALADDQAGWDWYALQFDDGSELMVYRLRRRDGSADPYSAGTWVPATGRAVALGAADVEIAVTDWWESPRGGRYPVAWRLAVPGLGLDVGITPVMKNQELTTRVRYWEGAVDVEGTRDSTAVSGRGYVELTGYAR